MVGTGIDFFPKTPIDLHGMVGMGEYSVNYQHVHILQCCSKLRGINSIWGNVTVNSL